MPHKPANVGNLCFAAVCLFQWGLIWYLLHQRHASSEHYSSSSPLIERPNTVAPPPQRDNSLPDGGVAVTVIFKAPKWFHLRYKVMIDNVLANIPANWKVQVFVNEPWAEKNLYPWHPGLRRLLRDDPRVIATPLPVELTRGRPRQVLQSRWFWANVAADSVLLFSGNGALCGNLPDPAAELWKELAPLDYCGVPSSRHDGLGGDGGSHSFRSRRAMLQVLDHAEKSGTQQPGDFLESMIRMNREGVGKFRLATKEQTIQFGGVYNLSSDDGLLRLPLVVAGTQARLTWNERDSLLKHCPELKMIFPSLHEPACFGAHPVAETCRATICALQEPLAAHGC